MSKFCLNSVDKRKKPRCVGANRCVRPASYGTPKGQTHRSAPTSTDGYPQGFKPRIARIARIILGQHDETDDTDFASGCALNNPVVELRLRSLRNCK